MDVHLHGTFLMCKAVFGLMGAVVGYVLRNSAALGSANHAGLWSEAGVLSKEASSFLDW